MIFVCERIKKEDRSALTVHGFFSVYVGHAESSNNYDEE
jgi:hypothetical protein